MEYMEYSEMTAHSLAQSPMESRDLATLQPAEAGVPLTSAQLRARLAVIQDVMKHVMQRDSDFGVIPGTQKPTLYKPGAEKLCVTFRLAADDPAIELIQEASGDIRYRVRVPIRSADGTVLAVGVGECSTGEEKYRWRRPVHLKEYEAAAEDQRREKWTREGDLWKQVRVHPADVANTVLKMAHKRAYVHAVIMATAAGAIFTQDIEDMPEGVGEDEPRRPPVQPPQRKAAPAAGAKGPIETVRIKVKSIAQNSGANDRGEPWTRTVLLGDDGHKYGSFDTAVKGIGEEAREAGLAIDLTYSQGKYGRDIQTIALVDREPGAEG